MRSRLREAWTRHALRPAVAAVVNRSLRTHFRRICWVGPAPALDASRPVVACANHHLFHDGYLMWRMGRTLLHRPVITWMADFDRYPFFAALGARPFPFGDARRRAATLRSTTRQMQTDPHTMLTLFPEAHLHPPEAGLAPFEEAPLLRMAHLMPTAQWWPVAMRATWWGDALPTLLMAAGAPRDTPEGLHAQLQTVLQRLAEPGPKVHATLMDGRRSPQERWSFGRRRPDHTR